MLISPLGNVDAKKRDYMRSDSSTVCNVYLMLGTSFSAAPKLAT